MELLDTQRHTLFASPDMYGEMVEAAVDRLYGSCGSHDRLESLLEEVNRMPEWPAMKLFKTVWPDCDATSKFWDEVLIFLANDCCGLDFRDFLDSDERAWFDRLPDRFRIYRGCDASKSHGLSWTTSLDVALGFARGHRGIRYPHPVVISGFVPKSSVLFATNDREEFEVLVEFDMVREKRVASYRHGPDGLRKV